MSLPAPPAAVDSFWAPMPSDCVAEKKPSPCGERDVVSDGVAATSKPRASEVTSSLRAVTEQISHSTPLAPLLQGLQAVVGMASFLSRRRPFAKRATEPEDACSSPPKPTQSTSEGNKKANNLDDDNVRVVGQVKCVITDRSGQRVAFLSCHARRKDALLVAHEWPRVKHPNVSNMQSAMLLLKQGMMLEYRLERGHSGKPIARDVKFHSKPAALAPVPVSHDTEMETSKKTRKVQAANPSGKPNENPKVKPAMEKPIVEKPAKKPVEIPEESPGEEKQPEEKLLEMKQRHCDLVGKQLEVDQKKLDLEREQLVLDEKRMELARKETPQQNKSTPTPVKDTDADGNEKRRRERKPRRPKEVAEEAQALDLKQRKLALDGQQIELEQKRLHLEQSRLELEAIQVELDLEKEKKNRAAEKKKQQRAAKMVQPKAKTPTEAEPASPMRMGLQVAFKSADQVKFEEVVETGKVNVSGQAWSEAKNALLAIHRLQVGFDEEPDEIFVHVMELVKEAVRGVPAIEKQSRDQTYQTAVVKSLLAVSEGRHDGILLEEVWGHLHCRADIVLRLEHPFPCTVVIELKWCNAVAWAEADDAPSDERKLLCVVEKNGPKKPHVLAKQMIKTVKDGRELTSMTVYEIAAAAREQAEHYARKFGVKGPVVCAGVLGFSSKCTHEGLAQEPIVTFSCGSVRHALAEML